MSAVILDGKKLADKIRGELKEEIARIERQAGCHPTVVNIMLGDSHGACAYAKSQRRSAEGIGIEYRLDTLPADIREEDLIAHIQCLNTDSAVHGIMVHKPIPEHLNYSRIANHVDIDKDLEGINVANIGKMILGKSRMIPCTPAAVMAHIRSTGLKLYGKEAVIVGHSEIVGKPLNLLLLEEYATVTMCHIATSEANQLASHVKRADILVVAVGKAGLIPGRWVKPGAVVIDVGINRVDNRICGDVVFDEAKDRAGYITPVPGGVGPVTVVMLMKNAVEAYKSQVA